MESSKISHIIINDNEYQISGVVDLSDYYTKTEVDDKVAFTKTENGGAYMEGCTATGDYALAEGSGTTASGNRSHAEGSQTRASGSYSHAEGSGARASGDSSHAEGSWTNASGNAAHSEGSRCSASGGYSHAEGDTTKATGTAAHTEGYYTSATTNYSHAEGMTTIANGAYAHAEGDNTIASGKCSHAEGSHNSALTECEHASGRYNISLNGSSTWGNSGNTLFTVGNGYYNKDSESETHRHNALQVMQNGDIYIPDTSADGEYYEKPMIKLQDALANSGGSTDGGNSPFILTENNGAQMSTCASRGQYAVAEGCGTQANGVNSHAEGGYTTASGYASHAEGSGAQASGDYSHAEGQGTSAATQSEHASGQYNISLSGSSSWGDSGNTLFTIGNGSKFSDRHNALQIMQDGTIYIVDTSGSGAYYQKPMINLQDVIKQLVDKDLITL